MAIPNGEIYLLKNVPLTATYEHTIDFKDKSEQFGYFSKFIKTTLNDYTYIRKEREYLTAELPISALDDVNYMIFRATDDERLYYAFITNKTYINDEVSQIFYIIDVMQTFQFDYEWKASFIKQSHVDRWTAEHKPIYSKTDENLDYGSDYIVENAFRIDDESEMKWVLVSLVNYRELINEGFASENANFIPIQNPFACLLLPIVTSENEFFTGIMVTVNGQEVSSLKKIGSYNDFLNLMLKSGIGKFVRSISLLPYNPFIRSVTKEYSFPDIPDNPAHGLSIDFDGNYSYFDSVSFTDDDRLMNYIVLRGAEKELFTENKVLAVTEWDNGIENSLPTAKQWDEVKANPYTTPRDKRFESKLLCYPYRYNLLTDWRTTPIVFKNEFMTTDKIEVNYSFALSYNAPFRYWIKDYKRDVEGRNTTLVQPIALEMPIISDEYYSYMLQNKNTIQANLTNATIGAISQPIGGAISGAGAGGWVGAIIGGVSGGVSGALNYQSHIRSENAKQKDLKSYPDTIISSTDSAFNVIDKNSFITFYRMRLCCENENIIAETFNMQGYIVNRVEIPNTKSRTRFNYIQTIGANIVGSINQSDLLQIKEIYDKGITIWHFKESNFNILDYSYENIEVSLI